MFGRYNLSNVVLVIIFVYVVEICYSVPGRLEPVTPHWPATSHQSPATHVVADRAEAIRFAIDLASEYDTVLIAGKGHEDYQILGTEKVHFDDREHAAVALKEKGG